MHRNQVNYYYYYYYYYHYHSSNIEGNKKNL